MQLIKLLYRNHQFLNEYASPDATASGCQLVIAFGRKELVEASGFYQQVSDRFPHAAVVFCSTAGEISGGQHFEGTAVLVGVQLEHSRITAHTCTIDPGADSFAAGKALVGGIDPDGLAYILVISDGLIVNGSQLIKGMEAANPAAVLITGGLAADGTAFDYTLVGLDGPPEKGKVAAIAFYGTGLNVQSFSVNGWDDFGPERLVTRSSQARLYEVDHESVIDLYRIYTGDFMEDKVNTTLLFPLSVKLPGNSFSLVRSILSIDHENNCLVLTGDIPEGSLIRFMRASNEKMVRAATEAATLAKPALNTKGPGLALVVSCVGRKSILEGRIDEEAEILAEILGDNAVIAGFYSYGELAPVSGKGSSQLHNQTISITIIGEQ